MRLLLLLSAILTALTGMSGAARAAPPVTASAAVAAASTVQQTAVSVRAIDGRSPPALRVPRTVGIWPAAPRLAAPTLYADRRRE